MSSLRRLAGAGSPIPARPAQLWTGEGAEEGLGTREGGFECLTGPVAAPASGAPAAREGRPRLPAYAGEDGPGLAMRGGESFHGVPREVYASLDGDG
jgi:hypothetical protein